MQKKSIWPGTVGLWLQPMTIKIGQECGSRFRLPWFSGCVVTLKPSVTKMIFVYAGTNKTKTNDFTVIRTIRSDMVTKAEFREHGLELLKW